MESEFFKQLVSFGIGGLFIAYLIYVCAQKDARYDKLARLVNDLQERRAIERSENAAENAKVMFEVANALKALGASVDVVVETCAAATRAFVAAQPRRRVKRTGTRRRRA